MISEIVSALARFLPWRWGERAYTAGRPGGPYQPWIGAHGSAEAMVRQGRQRVTARARDLDQNNPFVAGLIDKRTVRILGDEIGITPQIQVGDDREVSRRLCLEVRRRFYRWADDAMLDGQTLTDGLCIGLHHDVMDGEFLVKQVVLPGASGNPLRLQGIEVDHLDILRGVRGIEYDAAGIVPQAYWLHEVHPSDPDMRSPGSVRVPADQVYHYRTVRRFSQRRGISPLAPAIMRLYGVDDLEDAELIAARSAGAFGLVIKSPGGVTLPAPGHVGPDGRPVGPVRDASGKPRRSLEAGAILELDQGEDAFAFNSTRPNANFEAFVRNRKRDCVGPAGLSYEEATGDYSQVNYSSARMAQNIAWALTKRQQARVKRLLHWIYRRWLTLEVTLVGVQGIDARAYALSPEQYQYVSWHLAGTQGIDPVKEIKALAEEVALGVQSRTNYCYEHGRDYDEILRQLAEETAAMKAAGLDAQGALEAEDEQEEEEAG